MFNQDFGTDIVTMRGPTSRDHTVRFDEIDVCDYVNALGVPLTEHIVLTTLCDLYNRPER